MASIPVPHILFAEEMNAIVDTVRASVENKQNILMIGNSYTHTNQLNEMLKSFFELACEQFTAIHADIDPSFAGCETVEEALSAWQGLPNGEWAEHEDGTWLLVNSDGDTVGRSTELLMINAERYVSAGVEYCE